MQFYCLYNGFYSVDTAISYNLKKIGQFSFFEVFLCFLVQLTSFITSHISPYWR